MKKILLIATGALIFSSMMFGSTIDAYRYRIDGKYHTEQHFYFHAFAENLSSQKISISSVGISTGSGYMKCLIGTLAPSTSRSFDITWNLSGCELLTDNFDTRILINHYPGNSNYIHFKSHGRYAKSIDFTNNATYNYRKYTLTTTEMGSQCIKFVIKDNPSYTQ